MTSTHRADRGLFAGGLCSCSMAVYHFFLPHLWHWGRYLGSLPPTLRWGTQAINFFMSYLLLAGGVLTLAALRNLRMGRSPDRGVVVAMASFWLVNAFYQLAVPMPFPSRLMPLRWALIAFAAVAASAYVAAFLALRGEETR